MYLTDQYVINSLLHTEWKILQPLLVESHNFVLNLGIPYTINIWTQVINQEIVQQKMCTCLCLGFHLHSVLLSRFFHSFYFCLFLYQAWVHLLSPSTPNLVKLCWMCLSTWQVLACGKTLRVANINITMHTSQPGPPLCSVDTEMNEPLLVQ